MIKHRRYARLRALLAFALVPLVLFSNETQSAAAVVPGPWKQVRETIPLPLLGGLYGGNGVCSFNVQHAGSQINIGSGGYCLGLGDVTPGDIQPMEAGSAIEMRFSGDDRAQGGGCTASYVATLGQHDRNGTIRVAGSIPSGHAALGAFDECDITEVCILVGNGSEDGCFSLLLPYPEEDAASGPCVHGYPSKVAYSWEDMGPNPYNANARDWGLRVTVSLNVAGISTARWFVTQYNNGTGTTNQNPREITQEATWIEWVTNKFPYQGDVTVPPPMPPRDDLPWGYEVWALPEPWNDETASGLPLGHHSKQAATTVPAGPDDFYGGITQPDHCRWWIGKRLADLANTDADDPFTDFDQEATPPDEVDPEPEPVVEPPVADDDFNWWQAILAVLEGIARVLGGLAAAIANAILDALQGLIDGILDGLVSLFVPERTIQSRMDELDSTLDGRFPFNVADSLGSMGLAPGGGFDGRVPVGDGGSSSSGTASSGVGDGGCPDWKVIVDPVDDAAPRDYSAVCDSSFTSAIRGARPIILAGLLAAAFWPLVRGLFFASVPVIKPVPTNHS